MFVSQVSSVSNNMIILPFPVKNNVTDLSLFPRINKIFFLLKANEGALLLTFILHICLVFFFFWDGGVFVKVTFNPVHLYGPTWADELLNLPNRM